MTTPKQPTQADADPFKPDEPGAVATTPHTCKFNLTNNWDRPITNVTVLHTAGKQRDILQVDRLDVAETSKEQTCHFETGLGAPHDYWWIVFTSEGGSEPGTWTCKDNFYCDLRSGDAGKLVLTSNSVVDTDWYITEPSGRCYVSLNRK